MRNLIIAVALASVMAAEEVMEPPPLKKPSPTSFSDTMTMTALVNIGGERQTSGTLSAIVEDEVRGEQDTASVPPFGPYKGVAMYQMTIYANENGETVSFRFDAPNGGAVLKETLEFEVNRNVASVLEPLLLSATRFEKAEL
jgi:hypothetical protein